MSFERPDLPALIEEIDQLLAVLDGTGEPK
jgi:hypothetical protein